MTEWYEDKENILDLAEDLMERGEIEKIAEIRYLLQKPWKWQKEWDRFNGNKQVPTSGEMD